MFHLFKSVYLDIDLAVGSHGCDSIYIGPNKPPRSDGDLRSKIVSYHKNTQDFIGKVSSSADKEFWEVISNFKSTSSKLVVYVPVDILYEIQIEYWKSILPNSTLQSLYSMHQIYIEDCRFRSYLPTNVESLACKNAYQKLAPLSLNEFSILYGKIEKSEFLKLMAKENYSFEYQLADFFVNPHSAVKMSVLEKVKHFTWTNWIAELEILKGDILNGILDINRLLPDDFKIQIDDPTMIFPQALANPYLAWVADRNFAADNFSYVELNYDRRIFKFLYDRFYSLWQVNGEDMAELIDLIYDHRYEELLRRDVNRSFGCVYSGGRQRDKINQTLISMIYHLERNKSYSKLSELALHRI